MLSLAFSEKSLDVQRNVVIEEFKQRYLHQPYGDAWLQVRPLAYQAHPYRWATIGREIDHLARATMADAKAFFNAVDRKSVGEGKSVAGRVALGGGRIINKKTIIHKPREHNKQ